MTDKILLVDDDANLLAATRRPLRKKFELETARSGADGLHALNTNGPFAVVISDMRMPEMNGLEFLKQVKTSAPDTVRMILTGIANQNTAVEAVNEGNVFRFLNKPCSSESLSRAIEAGLQQYHLIRAERDLLERTLAGSVKVLIDVLSLVDPAAFGTSARLRQRTRQLAACLNLRNVWELELAAMLSPIGQLTLPQEVRAKLQIGDALTSAEQEMVRAAPEISRNLIANVPRLNNVSRIVYYQNKGYDGSGFPDDGLAGSEIPLGARLLKILIDLEAATQGGDPGEIAFTRLEGRAECYDPEILAAARAQLLATPDTTMEAKGSQRDLTISWLFPGDLLASDIETEHGQLILSAGHEITWALMERLRNLHKITRLKEPVRVLRPAP